MAEASIAAGAPVPATASSRGSIRRGVVTRGPTPVAGAARGMPSVFGSQMVMDVGMQAPKRTNIAAASRGSAGGAPCRAAVVIRAARRSVAPRGAAAGAAAGSISSPNCAAGDAAHRSHHHRCQRPTYDHRSHVAPHRSYRKKSKTPYGWVTRKRISQKMGSSSRLGKICGPNRVEAYRMPRRFAEARLAPPAGFGSGRPGIRRRRRLPPQRDAPLHRTCQKPRCNRRGTGTGS